MSRQPGITGFLIVALILSMTGCDSLTRDRFELINVQTSTNVDVRYTLGEPSNRQDGTWHYERPTRHLNVIIDFDNEGVVARKQWIEANTGEWLDSKEPDKKTVRETTIIRTIR